MRRGRFDLVNEAEHLAWNIALLGTSDAQRLAFYPEAALISLFKLTGGDGADLGALRGNSVINRSAASW